MLSFLQNPQIVKLLQKFQLNVNDLLPLWDMPGSTLDIVRQIIAYEAMQKQGQELATTPAEKFQYVRAWPIEIDTGILLYLLIRHLRPSVILECGTSFGASALFEASAVQKNQHGKVLTVEVTKTKYEPAQRNFQLAGLTPFITCEQMAFDQYLKHTTERFDLVFLDCDRSRYPFYFDSLLSNLTAKALIVVDNAIDLEKDIIPFKQKLTQQGWEFIVLPIGDGVMVGRKIRVESGKLPARGGSAFGGNVES